MIDSITIRAVFGGQERAFALTDPVLAELERSTDTGIAAIFESLGGLNYKVGHLREIIQLALIGGGASHQEAAELWTAHGTGRPIFELVALCQVIMAARWYGTDDQELAAWAAPQPDARHRRRNRRNRSRSLFRVPRPPRQRHPGPCRSG
ncbi:gene transfer agent family protein [Mangrovicoccus algicola]|uniref:Gene transfer agent family protein n=1 Tax=Mangrovicoccus algicola TaxID=2771008 RepID=A0A8J6Z1Q4_9RHOB|nr:gene transfer agent family protein [Mangrovicoccus algicola]MBE3639981.1 gene transfer agent family protein [Mangrovicoccus algicola]